MVVALGDSITSGHGGMRSWAQWLAEALGLPYATFAFNGATSADVVADQLPALGERRGDVGCVYVGVNDVREPGWDPRVYERDLAAILAALGERCARTLTLTLPVDLGLPPAGASVAEANAIVERLAGEHGALVADLRDFTGPRWVSPDRVHATAAGQVEIADRAARALGAPRLPSELARPAARNRR